MRTHESPDDELLLQGVRWSWRDRYRIYPGKLRLAIVVLPLLIVVSSVLIQFDIAVPYLLAGLAATFLSLPVFIFWVFRVEAVLGKRAMTHGRVCKISQPKDLALRGFRNFAIEYTVTGKTLHLRKLAEPGEFQLDDVVLVAFDPRRPDHAFAWKGPETH